MMVRKVDVTVQFLVPLYKDGSQSLAAERVRPTMPRPKQAAVDAPLHRRSAVGAALHEDGLQMLVANLCGDERSTVRVDQRECYEEALIMAYCFGRMVRFIETAGRTPERELRGSAPKFPAVAELPLRCAPERCARRDALSRPYPARSAD